MKKILPIKKRDIIENFKGVTYSKGFYYYRHKRVKRADVYEDGQSQWLIRAKVMGSRLYTQHIECKLQNYNHLQVMGECSCPVGFNCKHVVAVLFEVLNTQENGDHSHILQWMDNLLKSEHTVETSASEKDENAFVNKLVIRLFQEERNDFTFYKTKRLKNGTFSKGMKIHTDSLIRSFGNHYQFYYLTPEDHKLIKELSFLIESDYYHIGCRFRGEYGAIMLKKLAQSGKCYYKESMTPLVFDSRVKKLAFSWKKEKELYHLVSTLDASEKLIADVTPPVIIDTEENRLYMAESPYRGEILSHLLHTPPMSCDDVNTVSRKIIEKLPHLPFPVPETLEIAYLDFDPVAVLKIERGLHETITHPMVRLSFLYGSASCDAYPFYSTESRSEGEKLQKIMRKEDKERYFSAYLETFGFLYDESHKGFFIPPAEGEQVWLEKWRLFMEKIPVLREEGWQIEVDESFNYRFEYADTIVVEEEESDEINPWFELSFKVNVGGREIALLPVIRPLLAEYASVEELPPKLNLALGEGYYLHVDAEEIKPILQTVWELFGRDHKETVVVNPYDAHLLTFDEKSGIVWKGMTELKALSEKLKNFEAIETVAPAAQLNAKLRDYQQFGLNWLNFLHDFHFGGILADDMGLGKTVQTLAFLQYLKSQGRMKKPTLVIMPTSLIGNWKSEIEKFTPDLSYLELYGAERKEKFTQIDRYDIVLTTYQLAQRDREWFEREHFFYIVLDEAQKIKNPKTKMALAIKSFHASHRLALSGTPIENHLGELWSIFDFLMPGFLDNLSFFREWYQNPIEKERNMTRREILNRKTAPFILRRTKEEVVLELPGKTEIVKRAVLGKKQAVLYENIRVTMEKRVRETIQSKGLSKSHITILDALLKLRQVCCHPGLLKLDAAKKVKESAKLDLFMELIDELQSEGRKVLVFSQFTSMLTIIEEVLKKKKYRYSKLTGATRKREEAIRKFTEGEADIFLISLKAGGVGLNLVAADTVIHYDPWWNPAVENQATDRAYRIGQEKAVFVYKLIVEHSIEEQILKLQEKKKELQESIYGSDREKEEKFSGEELLELLSI